LRKPLALALHVDADDPDAPESVDAPQRRHLRLPQS